MVVAVGVEVDGGVDVAAAAVVAAGTAVAVVMLTKVTLRALKAMEIKRGHIVPTPVVVVVVVVAVRILTVVTINPEQTLGAVATVGKVAAEVVEVEVEVVAEVVVEVVVAVAVAVVAPARTLKATTINLDHALMTMATVAAAVAVVQYLPVMCL